MCLYSDVPYMNHNGVSFKLLQLATHVTLHNVHPRAVAASGAVQYVSVVVQSTPHLGFIRKKNCADLFSVFCFPDTNVAGLDNYVALK